MVYNDQCWVPGQYERSQSALDGITGKVFKAAGDSLGDKLDKESSSAHAPVGIKSMEWSDYMLMAAQHSKNNARHWFRYLRKYIDKYGIVFQKQDLEKLFHNEALTPFQRVSLRAAFEDGSQTRQHIISLNHKVTSDKIALIRERYKNIEL